LKSESEDVQDRDPRLISATGALRAIVLEVIL
jgi:hypothetical protein